jgi:hypothetical protein
VSQAGSSVNPEVAPWATINRPSGASVPRAVLLTLLLAVAPDWCSLPQAHADDGRLSPERKRDIVRDALKAFDGAVAIAQDDHTRAKQLFRQAAAAFESLVTDGARSVALEYNLGNTYFRLGELGRAILHYRRARQLEPSDAKLTANLRYARNRVEPSITASGEQRLLRRLLFWHYNTSLRTRFWFIVIASLVGWVGLAIWLHRRSNALALLSGLAIALALANAASAGWQLHDETHRPPAVVVEGEYVLRLGRGEGYDPAMRQPLGPGVELRVLQQRGDWVEVRLANGQTGWLPAAAIAHI